MRFDAIALNFDGVIIDSKRQSTQALMESMVEAGMPVTLEEALHKFGSKRWSDVLTILEERLGREIPESLVTQQYKRMSKKVVFEVGTMPGVEAFLGMTKAMPRAIASSSPPIWIEQTLARFGLQDHFGSHAYTTATLTHDKPHPEIYSLVAEKLDVAPHRVIAIEDNVVGVESAIAAGVRVIGFTAGSHILPGDAEAMQAGGAHFMSDDFEEVADWINSATQNTC
jgi:HAD superfamily hydrolase (TIGR01509 family)